MMVFTYGITAGSEKSRCCWLDGCPINNLPATSVSVLCASWEAIKDSRVSDLFLTLWPGSPLLAWDPSPGLGPLSWPGRPSTCYFSREHTAGVPSCHLLVPVSPWLHASVSFSILPLLC